MPCGTRMHRSVLTVQKQDSLKSEKLPAERCQPLSLEACHTAASGAQQPHLAGAPPLQTHLPAFQLSFPAPCSTHQCIERLYPHFRHMPDYM